MAELVTLQSIVGFMAGLGAGGLGWAKTYFELQKSATDSQTAQLNLSKARTELETQNLRLQEAAAGQKAALETIPYAYTVDEFLARFAMSEDGSILYTRRCTRIRARAGISEVRIPYRVLSPGGKLGRISLKGNPDPQPGLRLDTIDGAEPDRFEGDVVLSALSFKSQGDVGFTIEQRLERAFCLTREDAVKAFAASRSKRDYFGNTMTVPADRLVVEVVFPTIFPGVASAAEATAFYGESEIPNLEEINRLRAEGNYEVVDNLVRLTVSKPVKGQMYAVTWDPPPATDVVTG